MDLPGIRDQEVPGAQSRTELQRRNGHGLKRTDGTTSRSLFSAVKAANRKTSTACMEWLLCANCGRLLRASRKGQVAPGAVIAGATRLSDASSGLLREAPQKRLKSGSPNSRVRDCLGPIGCRRVSTIDRCLTLSTSRPLLIAIASQGKKGSRPCVKTNCTEAWGVEHSLGNY